MDKIVVYAAEGCPKCKALKKKLDDKGIKYDVCMDVNYMVNEKKFIHVPMMEVGEKALNFKEALAWANER